MHVPYTPPESKPGERDWRPLVSQRTFTWVAQLLIGAGLYWGYLNRHSGDLVVRFQAVALFLAGIWTSRLLRIRPAKGTAGAL